MRVRLRVTPSASRNAIGARQGALHARVTAPAQDGRANEAARALLAEALGVRARDVRIVAGPRTRDKIIEVPDGAAGAIRRLLARGG